MTSGRLTTHVLDIARGQPAADVPIELWRCHPNDDRQLLVATRTNADGRTDAPLLAAERMAAGTYELVFTVAAYFAADASDITAVPFLDRIPIRFAISDPTAHYHVPLLVTPWAYSTYRGS